MPNRVLREGILTSERVNDLSWPAEVFYRRLMSAVDDFGRFWAKPDLLRAALYPLRLDKVGNPDVVKWIGETREAGLVRTYTVEGKEYLQLLDFRQQVRAAKSKFPHPPDCCDADATQMPSTCAAHAPVVGDGGGDVKSPVGPSPDARVVLAYLNDRTGSEYQPVKANLELITARLKDGATVEECKAVIDRKVDAWGNDDKMATYLRPATLFNRTKFAQYQGERSRAPAGEVI